MSGRRSFPWHRVFHPLCGADLATLAGLVARRGPPSWRGTPAFAVAVATAAARLPFTALDLALAPRPRPPAHPPVFIVGHPRSGTTHLHNLMAASGAFVTVPPVRAAMPWEARTLSPLVRPFIDPCLPRTRLIDGVALSPEAPTEDEVGLANMTGLSYFHAIYFPARFEADYRAGLALDASPRALAARARAMRRYVGAMARGHAPLLLKNPAYTAQVAALPRLFPGARIIHIRRDPAAVFASTRRTLRATLRELALQDWSGADLDETILRTYPQVMAAIDRQAADLPPGRFAEIAFEDVAADPLTVLARLWDRLDLPGAAGAPARIAAYLETVAAYRPARNRLSPTDRERLARRWDLGADLGAR